MQDMAKKEPIRRKAVDPEDQRDLYEDEKIRMHRDQVTEIV